VTQRVGARAGGTSARALLRRQFGLVHGLLDRAIEGCTAEAIHRRPPGVAAPASACFAQGLLSEDLGVNGVLAERSPLALSTWFGRTGLSEVPPLLQPADWRVWACRVRVDLTGVWPYARAVYASTDAYIAALPDDALDVGRGEMPACLLSALLLTLSMRRGEIACLLALGRTR